MSRMPASRLARIGAWTGAAVAWGTTTVLVRVAAAEPAESSPPPPTEDTTVELGVSDATLPNPPDGGLVIIRYTPVTAPPQQVIVETKYVQVQAGPTAAASAAPAPATTAKTSTAPTAASTAAPAPAPVVAPPPPPRRRCDTHDPAARTTELRIVIHGTFPGLGTTIEAWCERAELLEVTVEWFTRFERVCSRFLPDSELSLLNGAEGRFVAVSPMLGSAISAADRARSLTGGLVDAGLGGALAAWGYDATFSDVTGLDDPPPPFRTDLGWQLEGDVLERDDGVEIDLGGIGKGWACDVAVESGWAKVASAGGDIRSGDPATRVPVLDPWGSTVAEVALGVGALATSSVTRRRWRVGSGEAHHLIDPRTGAPAHTPVLSATVVAETAVEAEAGAKAVLMLGADGLQWAERRDWIESALVVWHDGSVFATNGLELVA